MKKCCLLALIGLFLLDAAAQEATTIFLVRHAEKVDQSRDPKLSMAGKARAHRLMELLENANIRQIYSTDYKRTKQTVQPIASELQLDIRSYRPFDEEMVDELKSKYAGEGVLVVGHSNTIPDLVNKLIGSQKYEQLDEKDYSKLFVVTLIGQDVSHFILTL